MVQSRTDQAKSWLTRSLSSQGLVPCGREDCRGGISCQRDAQESSPFLQGSSAGFSRCFGDCSLKSCELAKEGIQSWAKAPTELNSNAHDSYPSFRFSIFVFFRLLRLCCCWCRLLCLPHDRGGVKSFCIDNNEVEAYGRQSRVSPCIHVNPWFRELLCCERRDNHLSLRFEPCFAARVANNVASHTVQLGSVSSNEASLRMLPLFVKMSQAPGSWSAVRLLPPLMLAWSPLHHWEVQSHPCVDAEFHVVQRSALWSFIGREP